MNNCQQPLILVTGANGFVGKALIKSLCQTGYHVRATVRSKAAVAHLLAYQERLQLKNLSIYNIGELSYQTDWSSALNQVDTVIHCAARAHVLRETSINPLETFRNMNTHVTARLARQACDLNVRRFIFLSSVGVLGWSSGTTPFTDASLPNPQVPYAQSKWEAEQALHALPNTMDKVIIRLPLVYGIGVKGNFGVLVNLIGHYIPMPFGAVKNKRQFIGIDNVIDFIMVCLKPNTTINNTFLIADKEGISTTQLLKNIAHAMRKTAILLPVSDQLLDWGLKFVGRPKLAAQLLGNLEIKANKAHDLLGWEPRYSMQEQLIWTVDKKTLDKKT